MSEIESVATSATPPPKENVFKNFLKKLVARKTMREIDEEISGRSLLSPSLNWIHLTGIGLGAIIGAGIFVLSGQAAAKNAGPSVIISFIATGIVALFAALSFSELMAMMQLSGAAYTYTYAALGEYPAWFIGWNYALLNQLSALTVVVNWSKYVVHLIDIVSDYNATTWAVRAPLAWTDSTHEFYVTGGAINFPAIIITLAVTVLLISGIRATAIVNLVLVVFKILVLLIFIFATCKYVDRKNYDPFIPSNKGSFSEYGVSGIVEACNLVFFAYVGFETVATVAEESQARTRPLPYATISSLLISLFIYIGICTVLVGLVPYQSLNTDSPLSDAIKSTPYGLWLSVLLDLGGIAGLTTVALTTLLSQTRIFFAMSHDGLLPSIFGRTHWTAGIPWKTDTPWVSTIFSGVICAVFAGFCPIDVIGETSSISALITYLFVHIDLVVLRYTRHDANRIFKVPFGPWLVPAIGSILCQFVYFSYGFRHSKKRKQAIQLSSRISDIELVPTIQKLVVEYSNAQLEPNIDSNINQNNEVKFYVNDALTDESTPDVKVINETNEDNMSESSSETINEEDPAKIYTIT
ncbi:hypothetical protein I4U23_024142 [Adineta vaga]|nr:hypothetical protein I4U23_024142 [Adineta vaga]